MRLSWKQKDCLKILTIVYHVLHDAIRWSLRPSSRRRKPRPWRRALWLVQGIVVLGLLYPQPTDAVAEGIGMDPINVGGFQIGELSVAQGLLFVLVFLELVLLYAMGVIPVELDIGGVLQSTRATSTQAPPTAASRSVNSPPLPNC